ncbi:CsbD family protein [Celeribacter sp.]|uniref:CsbD family protein n=1 Tax=Celeribacter sp. TaxID=1890673 RepID=UPI003A8EAD6B
MSWDIIEGKWKQFKGKAREEWGELTDDELDQVSGERQQLEGLLQEKYGKTKAEAKEAVDSFAARVHNM